MDLSKELVNVISPHDLFNINVSGISIPVSDTVAITWVVMAFLIIAALYVTRGLKTVPEGRQNFAEWVTESINNLAKTNTGCHWEYFAPYLGTVLLFLITANIISVFNVIPGFNLRPPTKDVNVTSCMAIMSIFLVLLSGILIKRPGAWMKSFFQPTPVIAPFKVLDYFIRPISLCFRLFGNILGSFIIMELIYIAIPVILPAGLSIYFDLFDGALQAYIFVFLTSLYIGEAVE